MLAKSSSCIHTLTTLHHPLKFHADLCNFLCVPLPLCTSFFARQPKWFIWKLRSSGHSSGLTLQWLPIWLTVKAHALLASRAPQSSVAPFPLTSASSPFPLSCSSAANWPLCCFQPLRAQFCLGAPVHPSPGMFVFHLHLKIPSLKSIRSLYKSRRVFLLKYILLIMLYSCPISPLYCPPPCTYFNRIL